MAQPIIQYSTTQQFSPVWMDYGSSADADGGFWRPTLASGQAFLGDFAQGGYDYPWQSTTIITGVLNDDPAAPALSAPASFNPMWWYVTDIDFGNQTANFNVIWSVVAPNNYLACGSVVSQTGQISWSGGLPQPSVPGLVCVRQDLVQVDPGGNLGWVWNDKGSGNDRDVGVWLAPRLNFMVATPNYDQPGSYNTPANAPHLKMNYGRRLNPAD